MIKQLFNCRNTEECIRVITVLAIVLLIQMLLIRYFWNNALVPHVTVLKPINTVTDALMLSLGISLVTALA
jgi:hypothetical protein